MKKTIYLFVLLGLSYFLLGCTRTINEDILTPLTGDENIDMDNVDEYMFRSDIQYVDLRNFEDRFKSGYIDGFESIPFFDYLDNLAFYRNDTFEFDEDQLINQNELKRLFDIDKSIFLFADGCIRSGYIKDALNYLGYTNVFVLGGYYEYTGQYKVLGDGSYEFNKSFYGRLESESNSYLYYIFGNTDSTKKIIDIRIDIIDENGQTLRGNSSTSSIDYNTQLQILENYIISDRVTLYQLILELEDGVNSQYYNIENYSLDIYEELFSLIAEIISYTNQ